MMEDVHSSIFGSTTTKIDKKGKILPEIGIGKVGRSTVRVRNKTQVDGFPALVS